MAVLTSIVDIARDTALKVTAPLIPRWTFATVLSVSPTLSVRLAGESDPLIGEPLALVPVAVGDVVEVRQVGRRVVISANVSGGVGHDTGWKPHGGTLAAGINIVSPIEYRIIGPVVHWRGQFWKTGGWAANGAVNTVITGLPEEVRPQSNRGALAFATDTVGKFSGSVTAAGELLVYAGHTGIWPAMGGSYPLLHGVGAPLAPPADTGWTNIVPLLQNSWTAYGAFTPQYRVRNGVTEMRGLIARTAGAPAADSTIFTLPSWAAPELGLQQRHYACRCSTAAAVSGLAVKSDGVVMYQNGTVGWISLDQISYTARGQ